MLDCTETSEVLFTLHLIILSAKPDNINQYDDDDVISQLFIPLANGDRFINDAFH